MQGVRVLITGGAGFIGAHLVRRLLAEKAEVHTIDIDSKAKQLRLSDVIDNVHYYNINLKNATALRKVIKAIEPEIIYHLGAFALLYREMEYVRESLGSNVIGTVNLLNALSDTDFSYFVNTSTYDVYGHSPAPFREDTKLSPPSPYAASKLAAETYCKLYHDTYGYPITTLRPSNVYGPMQLPNRIIPELIASCLRGQAFTMTKGEQKREFNYVEDIVQAFVVASRNKKSIGEIFNVGCGKSYKIKDVVQAIVGMFDKKIEIRTSLPYRKNEPWDMWCDNTKIRALGWKPEFSLTNGLKKTVDWYKNLWKKNSRSEYFSSKKTGVTSQNAFERPVFISFGKKQYS